MSEPWEGDGPCQDCGAKNVTWFTDSPLWNRVMSKANVGIVCVTCFVKRASVAGVNPTAWKLVPEVLGGERRDSDEDLRFTAIPPHVISA